MVESARIDMAHHSNNANRALRETVEMDNALGRAMEILEESGQLDDTLIIVTADHAHTMAIQGYAFRGRDIRGEEKLIIRSREKENPFKKGTSGSPGADLKPYTMLNYANGPNFENSYVVDDSRLPFGNPRVARADIGDFPEEEIVSAGFRQSAGAPRSSESHAGDDVSEKRLLLSKSHFTANLCTKVGIFSSGPFSHLFHSVHEQPYIAHVMAYAACIGQYAHPDNCGGEIVPAHSLVGNLIF